MELDEKCWKGYEKKRYKTMFGKDIKLCQEEYLTREELEQIDEIASINMFQKKQGNRLLKEVLKEPQNVQQLKLLEKVEQKQLKKQGK